VHPKYLVFQLAPWDLDRSTLAYMPIGNLFSIPTPYFTEVNGIISIQNPYYLSEMWQYASNGKISEFMKRERSLSGFIEFTYKIYLPIKLHELCGEGTKIKNRISGKRTSVLVDKIRIETHVLQALVKLAKKNNTHLIFLLLGDGNNWYSQFVLRHRQFLKEHESILSIADAEGSLWNNLKSKDEKLYQKTYMHWAGNPPEIVDRHPNDYSHHIIANEILKYVE
jgi:hypothetical protein